MADIAVTSISHGKSDGERIEIAAGERVDKKLFTKQEYQDLVDAGAVESSTSTKESEDEGNPAQSKEPSTIPSGNPKT